LKHRLIPPTLHFERPNPKMDFIDSPFYVNTVLSAWGDKTRSGAGGFPLRAGVCSFGIGGTNAFVLVEEPLPAPPAAVENKVPQLLLLSARGESALEKMTANLVEYLKNNPGVNLGDVAYTLQVGRRPFSHRRMLVCPGIGEAVQALSCPGDDRVQTSVLKGKSRDLTDMPAGERGEILKKMGLAWLRGARIDWQEFYGKYLENPGRGRFRIPLPTYPFERQRYWIDADLQEFSQPDPGVQRERMPGGVEMEAGGAGLYPRPALSTEYVAPNDEVERSLVGVWQKFFGIGEVGIYDDFFELGGDSLKAITVVLEIHKRMDTRVPITGIFQSPTIKELAEYIKGAGTDKYSAIGPVEQKEYYPLSSVQERLFVLQQMDTGGRGYHDTLIFRVEGELDKNRLQEVFNHLVARHESLRTSFELIGEEHVQRIKRGVIFAVEYYDGEVEEDGNGVIKGIIRHFIRPFDLSRSPLLRVGLVRTNKENHLLMTDMHHIITDGSSIGLLIREFITLYSGGFVPPLRIRYRDYTQWQTGEKQREVMKKQETYWLNVFADEIPVLNLPVDYARPAVRSFAGSSKTFIIGREETGALKRAAANEDATLFMILFSVYHVMLARICGQEDIVVGTPIAARTHADLQDVVGMFVNTLALRNYPRGEKTFREFLREVREHTLAAYENQDYLFEDLVEQVTRNGKLKRDTGRNPVFDTLFNILNIQSGYEANLEIKSPGLSMKLYEHEKETSEFDLIFQGSEENGGLCFTVFFSTRLFKPGTVDRFIGYFRGIVSTVSSVPDIKLAEIEILSGEEKRQLLVDFNDTAAGFPRDKTIHELFAEQAERTPDHIAVVEEEKLQITNHKPRTQAGYISYRELSRKAGQLAGVLKEKGVGPDVIVGIMMERSVDLVIGFLGILKAGGAYLPIDPQYPQGRIEFMLKDSEAGVLVNAGILAEEVEKLRTCEVEKVFSNSRSSNLAYVIYTSGTTGTPRGVLIRHRGVINMVNCHRRLFAGAPGERVSQSAGPGFDAMVSEVWPCLLSGAALYIVDNEVRADSAGLKDRLIKQGINISFQPTIIAEELLEEEWPGQGVCLRVLQSAGDRLKKYPVRFYPFRFYNLYGPTEDTVWTTWTEVKVKVDEGTVKYPPIGKPIDNHRVYILSTGLGLQPLGVPGELCIGGEGVSVGYLNNPELTKEKFQITNHKLQTNSKSQITNKTKNTFNEKLLRGVQGGSFLEKSPPGRRRQKLYKTGDLARWLPDGNIEFLGRLDHQVKIRGYRVELGEIERCLMALPGVKEAVVTSGGGEKDEKYLCAYIVVKNEAGIDVSFLRQGLSGRLPNFMIPSRFVTIDNIPLTPHGKVDRKALPEPGLPGSQPGSGHLESAAPMEKLIAETWQGVLNLDNIGINDNFFGLGGNSVSLVKVIVKLRKILKREIPTEWMFQYPTVHLLARHITEEEQTGLPAAEKREHVDKPGKGVETLNAVRAKMKYMSVEPVEMKDYYPLSSAQKRLYFLQQMDVESVAYNMPFVLPLGKDIEKDKLESVLKRLVARHESLRTSFTGANDEPVQKIRKAGEIDFANEYYGIEGGIEKIIECFVRSFDLSRAPLIRSGIIERADGNLIWMVDAHHIVSDGTSHTILTGDFFRLYDGDRLEPLKLQYKDFSRWQNRLYESGAIKAHEDYWLTLYADIAEIPRLDIMGDYKRPELFTFAGGHYSFVLSRDDALKFKANGARDGGTLFMNILTVLNVLFYRYTGQTDIIIGSGIAGRSHDDFQEIIGMFVNMLAMRNYPAGEKPYQVLLKEVIHHSIQAFENQDVQFEELVDRLGPGRDLSRNPLFDITMMVQDYGQVGERGSESRRDEPFGQIEQLPVVQVDEDLAFVAYNNRTSKFDLTFFIYERGEDIHVAIEYYTGIFKIETIQRLAVHFQHVIKAAAKDPSIRLRDIEIIPEEEKQQVLYEFNNTAGEFPTGKTIQQLFEEKAAGTPEKIAAVGKGERAGETTQLTYRKLNRESGQLARLLREKGAKPGIIVAIMMERSIEMIIGIMGILKAGSAYLPVDGNYPQKRIEYMLADSGAGILVSKVSGECGVADVSAGNRLAGSAAGDHRHLSPAPAASPAYIIYTSGTTGKPKGVMVEHRHVVNLVFGLHRNVYSRCRDNLKVALVSPYVFDASVKQIFASLLLGHTLCIVPGESRMDGGALKEYYRGYGIDISDGTPTHLRLLSGSDRGEQGGASVFTGFHLKHFIIGGEELPGSVVEDFLNRFLDPKPKITNVYGPTECCVDSTWYEVPGKNINGIHIVPIGKPMPNVQVYIVDEAGGLVPVGVPGELCAGGDGVSRGYLNSPELTKEKFLRGSRGQFFQKEPPGRRRHYKTGDLARWRDDGNIEFLGRIDRQVKVRGFRIEPGEIEIQLLKIEGIHRAVVVAGKDHTHQNYLCAYIVSQPGINISPRDIKRALTRVLPTYMVPAYLMEVDHIPLTAGGKVDLRAFPAAGPEPGKADNYVAPGNEGEEKMVEIWAEVLGIEKEGIGVRDDFFARGGHSLKATILTAKIHKVFNVGIPLVEIFRNPTVEGICSLIPVAEWVREQDGKMNVGVENEEVIL
jgi:amino acid adenylation domain-containing protein